jgi:uncharacterized protein (TIGR04255 family)
MDEGSLLAWLNSHALPRRGYPRTPLMLALCQIRYAKRIGLEGSRRELVGAFQDLIEKQYPVPEEARVIGAEVQFSPAGVATRERTAANQWTFTDVPRNWTVTLTEDFVTLEAREYSEFAEFRNRLMTVLESLITTVQPTLCVRVGLRYINEIREDFPQLSKFIQPYLLGLLSAPALLDDCEHSVSSAVFNLDRTKLHLQHGYSKSGTTVVPRPDSDPASSAFTSPFYLIDTDVYEEFNKGREIAMSTDRLIETVDRFHDLASKLFRAVITKEYDGHLEGRR